MVQFKQTKTFYAFIYYFIEFPQIVDFSTKIYFNKHTVHTRARTKVENEKKKRTKQNIKMIFSFSFCSSSNGMTHNTHTHTQTYLPWSVLVCDLFYDSHSNESFESL